jgi:LemA protein
MGAGVGTYWAAAVGALLLFWALGAHNRLVGLRGVVVKKFEAVDAQFKLRHELLQEWISAGVALWPEAEAAAQSLGAACRQAEVACAHAKSNPSAVGAVGSLRLSENILNEARARLLVQMPTTDALAEINLHLVTTDAMLAFARQQFNAVVQEYNQATRQFPTVLIAGALGFRVAGSV